MSKQIRVEVAYALMTRQTIIPLDVAEGTTAAEAVRQSGIAALYAGIDPDHLQLGIFSRAIRPETVLRDGDRVEIYRPLLADPKAVRRQRAAEGRGMRKGG